MGQATSKRRSYTPASHDKSEESRVAKSSRANGDLKSTGSANGSIEVRSSGGHDSGQIEADDPTSPTSVTSDTSTGRKETKRKRFRVSGLFSLKRTPSGKWPRRRKTASSAVNGSRPMSCPDPQSEGAGVASPARPQSLFLEELEITEDDNKIETVDLSDHEQDGKSKPKSGKSSSEDAPKAPPKTKGRRGSKKQSSLKKKKQEKKKEKKSKSKQKAEAVETEDATTSGAETETPSCPSEVKTEISEKPDAPGMSTDADEPIPCLTAAEERRCSSSLGLTQQIMAHIDAKSNEDKAEQDEIRAKKDKEEEEEEDLDAVASSIVAETMDIAQKRLGEEKTPDGDGMEMDPSISDVVGKTTETDLKEAVEDLTGQNKEVVVEDMMVQSTDVIVESTPPAVEGEITPSTLMIQESTPQPQAPPRRRHSNTPSAQSATETASPVIVSLPDSIDGKPNMETGEVSVTAAATSEPGLSLDPSVLTDPANVVKAEAIENAKEKIQQLAPDTSVDSLTTGSLTTENQELGTAIASVDDKDDTKAPSASLPTEHFNEAAVDVGEEIAAVSASVAAIEGELVENGKDEEPTNGNADTEKDRTTSVSSDSDKQNKADSIKDKNEKKRLEKERLKREKEAEKERQKEEKRKKAEQKSAEKEKNKSEKKIKVPKRLSSLFHRKDKQPKVVEVDTDSPSNGATAPNEAAEPAKAESSLPQTVETMVCPAEQVHTEEHIEINSSSEPTPSLNVDVSVEPLSITTPSENDEVCQDSQPTNGELSSSSPQPPLESPISEEMKSPGSDTSEPTSPGSDCDVNGSSSGSGILKKISLGPRLRTAILRKKSSSASDSGAEHRVSLTTPKSVADSGEMTPPPRKLRPRKPVEPYSCVTPGAHNPPVVVSTSNDNEGHNVGSVVANIDSLPGDLIPDKAVKDIADEINTEVGDAKSEAALTVGQEIDKINSAIDSDNSKEAIEVDKYVNCEVSIEGKNDAPETEAPAVETSSTIENVLGDMASKAQSLLPVATHKDIFPEQSEEQFEVSENSSVCQSVPSKGSVAVEPSEAVEETIVASTRDTVKCAILSHPFLKEVESETKDNSDTDDTDPSHLDLKLPSIQQQQQSESRKDDEEEPETLSTLQSPTLVSTASIMLRPSSVDDTCPDANTSLEEVTDTTVKKAFTTFTQTTYVKSTPAADLDSLTSFHANDSSSLQPAEDSAKTPPQQDSNGNLFSKVESAVQSSVQDRAPIFGGETESSVKDVDTEGEERDEIQAKQIYTAVCAAQVYGPDKDDGTIDKAVEEELITASSKPKRTVTIAEYQIGTFEESPQEDGAMTDSEKEDNVNEGNESKAQPADSVPSSFVKEATAVVDSFLDVDVQESADVTLTENAKSMSEDWDKTIIGNQEHRRASSGDESEDSGKQTPTPNHQQQQQKETVDSVINGIVSEAVNGVLQEVGHHNKQEESLNHTERSPPSTPEADDTDGEVKDGEKVSSVESSPMTDSSLPDADDNEIAADSTAKDLSSSVKPSPTETIEAYLKLQYQEDGDSLSTSFVNGDKGFEENGNVLITTPATTTTEVVTPLQDEQVTG